MPLTAGTKLGPYEIQSPLGAGGMGEVYRARDSRLDRSVAIKVLPAHLASNTDLKIRLEREARAVSRLSHPHICTLHDIGHQDGVDFLVMEYLEGETLEHRLRRGPLPPDQVLRYAAQIADALAKAHKLGITHRDLKPANVMLTKSGAKLMDFGLAKQSGAATVASALTEMTSGGVTQAEMTSDDAKLTSAGMIVGTFQYMAPEQLEGKEADARTDIFAFGELVHEMVTGKPAFSGKSRASLIAAILTAEPTPITQLEPITPQALEHVVKKCLAKDPDERWQSASDLASELNWILSSAGSQSGSMAAVTRRQRGASAALRLGAPAALILLAACLGWLLGAGKHRDAPVHLTVTLPEGKSLVGYSSLPLAISPDGLSIVYAAVREDRKSQLFLRKLNDFASAPIAGTEGAYAPFFSPDGEWLAFVSEDFKLMKVLLRGGSPVVVAEQARLSGTWAEDGTIYFLRNFATGLFAVPAAGGETKRITQPGSAVDDRAHLWPDALPGGNAIIFTVWTGRSFNDARIEALDLKSGKRKVLIEGGTGARYLSNGLLAFARNGTLFVVAFDPKRLEVNGAPAPVLDGIMTGAANGDAEFSVSRSGTLAFQPGTFLSFQRNLVWMDRAGKITNITPDVKPYGSPALSPDGKLIAVNLQGSSFDNWVYDLERETFTKATFGADDYRPSFSPDGTLLAYDSSKSGSQQVWVKQGIAQGTETVLTDGPEDKQLDGWNTSGREVIFSRHNKDTGWDLYAAAIDGDHKPRILVTGPFNQRDGKISPDGKWLAYVSDESGQNEIFVQAMNDPNMRAQISSEGGIAPRWSHAGNELFFMAKTKLMSVKLAPGGRLSPGKPTLLFEDKRFWSGYDVTADGRFLVARDAEANSGGNQINVVPHWFDELKRQLGK